MTQFYDIMHNTAYKRGMPEIGKIVEGINDTGPCRNCGAARRTPIDHLKVQLGRTRARLWPDLLACGDYPCFVISERFLDAMQACDIKVSLGGKLSFVGQNISGISLDDAPRFYWVNGERCQGAKMDFEASGYVDVRFCPDCGSRSNNISLTYDRQHANPPPGKVFEYDDNLSLDLFTTDLSPTAFFCTDRLVDCARRHKLINLALVPIEEGVVGKPLKL